MLGRWYGRFEQRPFFRLGRVEQAYVVLFLWVVAAKQQPIAQRSTRLPWQTILHAIEPFPLLMESEAGFYVLI
ncbi:MAG: hypothetical protein BGO16_06015 [Nitrobacter sp. 62-23]|nr:MAG: hypothetical protein BGO16_06015 [Nitrobacter sp. 62-23]